MIAASLTLIVTAGFTANKLTATGAADPPRSSASSPSTASTARVSAPAKCPDHRAGLRFYRGRHAYWQGIRGIEIRTLQGREARSCPDARYLAVVWRHRATVARKLALKHLAYLQRITLHDFRICDGCSAWHRAVDEVQRVFPGTSSWLLSCSAAEGGHGRWVGYGGQGYSTWLRDSDTVGGFMQFRWSTFKGMYRNALEYVLSRGYTVPEHMRDPSDDITWRSALGQAMAGGWARYTGNDNSHWSASWGNGC